MQDTPDDVAQVISTTMKFAPFVDKLIDARAVPAIVIGVAIEGGNGHPVIAYDEKSLTRAQLADTLRRLADGVEKGSAAAHN
jgi:uncharacterized protein with FMN-binding domain